VDFEPLQPSDDQKTMLLSHLGISCSDRRFDSAMCDKVLAICDGVPLALAMAAAHVRSDSYNWHSVLLSLRHFQSKAILGGHPGWDSVFGASLARLDKDRAFLERQAGNKLSGGQLRYSWAEAYGSLAVLDKSSPRVRSVCCRIFGALRVTLRNVSASAS
jgi:hypothetical protein